MKCESYLTRNGKAVCFGTREMEPCSCQGDCAKCDFYDYVRERALKQQPQHSTCNDEKKHLCDIIRAAMKREANSVADSADLYNIFRDCWGMNDEDIKSFGYEYLINLINYEEE